MQHLLCSLAALLPLAQESQASRPQSAPAVDCATLERQFNDAQTEWNRRLTAAKGPEEVAEARKTERPEVTFTPRFLAGATAGAGTDAAVPYLAWLVSRGDLTTARTAMTTLMERHIEHPGITLAVARLGGLHQQFGLQPTRAWLDRVLELNQDPGVRAQAHYTRAALYVGTRAAAHSDGLRTDAIADLQAVLAGAPSPSLRGLATTLLDEAQRLEPGLLAPDIEGEDLAGVRFKLSDYRGKVVMLDFWGDW